MCYNQTMKRVFLILLALAMLAAAGVGEADELMQQGSKGEEVVRVQMRLFDLGFYTYKPTGSYQTVTRSAVVAYQAASGIMSDGSIGSETLRALFSRGAKRVDFHAEIPLSFTAQGAITQKGNAMPWDELKGKLTEGAAYTVRNAATGEDVRLLFSGGEQHAELTLPVPLSERTASQTLLERWLGASNSFYKCAALLELDGQWIAASMQWDGENRVCLYVTGSRSHVHNLPDAEHDANVKKATF